MKNLLINKLPRTLRMSKETPKATLCKLMYLITSPLRVTTYLRGRVVAAMKGELNVTPDWKCSIFDVTFLHLKRIYNQE